MPSAWLAFDRLRELFRSTRLYQQDRILQDQDQLDRITVGGDFLDWNQQSGLLEQTNLQINRLERYKDYEQMDQTGEVSLALDLYADECSIIDPERKHTLIIRANSKRLKDELEQFFFQTLLWDKNCRPIVRYLCKYGCSPFEIVMNKNRDGVASMRFMNIYNFTRIETRYGDLVGFFYQDEMLPEPVFLHPWQVMHLRLTSFENIYHPYGRSILDGGRKAFKQLRLMEDAALIYRITRAPEKRMFSIPVGNIPPKEVPEYMQMIARSFKRRRFYNPATGQFDERYSPLIQEDDFFLPERADGTGPKITTLPGAENLDQIADIEYFKKKMIAPMKIPFSRVGIGDGAGEPQNQSLSQTHSEFAKAVRWIQSEVSLGLTKVALVHLALRGYTADDLRGFELALSASSAIEDLYRIETWQTRVGVMSDLKEIGWFPKEWIVTHFTDLTPDEIEELKEMEEAQAGGDGGGDSAGGGALGMGGGGGGMDEMGGEEEGGGEEMGGEGGEEGEEEDEELDMELERIDKDNRRLITEIINGGNSDLRRAFVEKIHAKKEKPTAAFDYLLEAKELDGLTTTEAVEPEAEEGGPQEFILPSNPNDTEGILCEWSVNQTDREEAIMENAAILLNEAEVPDTPDEQITEHDIPA